MIDIFVGKPPSMNRHEDIPSPPIQHDLREILSIFRKMPAERRKNTKDRRRNIDPDVIVKLSGRPERRTHLDRRGAQGLLLNTIRKKERRRSRIDRRNSGKDGIKVSLQSRPERRMRIERRKDPIGNSPATSANEIQECLESMKSLMHRLQSYL